MERVRDEYIMTYRNNSTTICEAVNPNSVSFGGTNLRKKQKEHADSLS